MPASENVHFWAAHYYWIGFDGHFCLLAISANWWTHRSTSGFDETIGTHESTFIAPWAASVAGMYHCEYFASNQWTHRWSLGDGQLFGWFLLLRFVLGIFFHTSTANRWNTSIHWFTTYGTSTFEIYHCVHHILRHIHHYRSTVANCGHWKSSTFMEFIVNSTIMRIHQFNIWMDFSCDVMRLHSDIHNGIQNNSLGNRTSKDYNHWKW